MKFYFLAALLLCLPVVMAADYTPTGKADFNVYADSVTELDGYVYSTIEINQSAYPNEEFRCLTLIFANQNGTYLHVQSNPPHILPTTMGILSPNSRITTSPEALGYFPVNNGLANVYFRSKDVIAYNDFLYVVLCNSNQTSLVYEQNLTPIYKEFGKSLPSRGAWFAKSENADTVVILVAALGVVGMFVWFGILKKG